MTSRSVDLLIVGAGISGLGMARMAKRQGLSPLVLEASSHLGGAIHTHHFDTPDGPFWAELGGHTCYNSYGNLLELLEETGQLNTLQAKEKLRYKIQIGDRLESIPSQLNFLELLGVLPRLWMSQKAGRSVRDYYGRLIGRRNYAQVLGPALDAVVCQPAADFPADALFRKKPRRKEVLRSYTGPMGLQSFVTGIATDLEIQTQTPVKMIEKGDAGYCVSLHDGGQIEANRVALAVAPDVAADLLRDLMPSLASRLDEIEMAEIESHAVLVRAGDTQLPEVAGIIGHEDDFFSVVSRDLVPQAGYRAFTFHFRPGRLSEQTRLTRICEVLGVDNSAIISSVSLNNRLPALRLGHADRIAWVDRQLQDLPLGLTGNWFQGVSIEDSLVRTSQEFNRLIG
ncbi:MAG: FAD-dependent oxidoreductase [Candidatus Thiodiazotropha sp. (ex Myrtea sp. 'scaly one' KF741663)]|nr:FAD-dependent oxidoreductase [Candidatus Thiodiazotropha sp. (ex Myrtea sp. 'scaly one' KF741663)]